MLRAKLSHLEILNPNRFNPVLNITARGLTTAGIAQSGGVTDLSGNGNNGTAYGGVEVVNDSEMGECFSFDGSSNRYIAINLSFLQNKKQFTFSVKFRLNSLPTGKNMRCLYGTYSTGYLYFFISIMPNGSFQIICLQKYNTTGYSNIGGVTSANLIAINKPYTLTYVADFATKSSYVYLDGNLVQSFYNEDASDEEITNVYYYGVIGRHRDNFWHFDGLISEVKIFPYALNSNEVKELYRMSQNPSGIVPSTELMSTEALDYDSKYWEPRITDSVDIERFFDINSDTANRIRTLQIGLDNSDRRFDRYMADGRSLLNNIMTLYYDTEKTAMAPKGEILHLSAVGLTTAGIKQENGIPDLSGNGNDGRTTTNGFQVVHDNSLGDCFQNIPPTISSKYLYIQKTFAEMGFDESTDYTLSFNIVLKSNGHGDIYLVSFGTGYNTTNERRISITNTGKLSIVWAAKYGSYSVLVYSTNKNPQIELDTLYNITLVQSSSQKYIKLYINGALSLKLTVNDSSDISNDGFLNILPKFYTYWTYTNTNSNTVNMNDIYIYHRALTDEEVHDIYLSTIPDNNPIKRSFTGSIQSIDSYGSEVRLTLRELGYEYLEQNYPDAQIAYDYYSDSGINESWNCIPIHFGTVKGIPLSWVNSFYSEYMIGSGPILRVTRIYIDTDRSLPETDTSEVDGKDNGVLYKLVNNVGTETGYKPSSSDPDTEVIHVRIFRGTGYDADGQREIVTDSYHPETADSARWNNGSTAGTYNHISQWGGFAYIQLFKIKDGYEVPAYPYNHDGSIGQVYVDIEGIVPVTKSGNTYAYGNTMVRNPAEIIKMMFCNPQLTNEGPCAIGFGYSESDVDFSNAIADCESLGLKIDGSFNQTGQFSEALKKILYHCRGYIIEEDSKIKLVVDMPVERVSASFDETGEYGHDCNLETWAEPNLDEQFNRARLSYAWNYKNSKFDKKPDPNHESPDYDSSNPTATSVYDEWLYDEDSYRTLKKWNTMEIELDMVHDTMTAHKLASYYLRKSIYQKIKGTISVDPESAVNLDAGNLIKIRSEQFGWYMTYYDTNGSETVDTEDGKMFQITSVRKGQELTEIDFVEYNSEIFLLDSVGTMTAKTNESEVRKKLAPQKPVSVGVSEKTPIKNNNGTYLCAVDVVVTYQSGTPVSTVIQMGDAGTGNTAPSSSGVIWNDVAMISENRTTITGLTPGHWYYFKVFSINANGSSVPVISNAVHVQGDSTAPEVPTLTIDSITGRSVTVKVVLNNAPDDFAGFAVRRGNTVLEKVPCGRIATESSGTVTYRAEINYVNVCELYDTDYTFSASAYDMWGNESNACTGVTAHTEEAIDLTDIESSIDALETDMTDTNTRITGYASDNVLSIGEKAELAKDWLSIKNDRYQKIKTEAENHGMNLSASSYKTDYDNFVSAYNALLAWVDGSSSNIALIPTPPDQLQESSFANVCSTTAQKFADYQTCEIKLLSDIDKDNKNRATAIYAECNTPADVASKIVILPDVVIFDGLRLCVKFLNGNSTVQTITLNIKRDESDVSGLIDGGQLYTEKGIAVPVISINAGEMITFVLVERKIINYSNGTTTTTNIKVWEFADSALLGMGQNGTVQNETYSLGMVNGGHIIAHTVDTQQLKAQSVTTDILKAGAVTTDKITSEQIIGRDFRTDTDVGIRDSLTGLYNSGVMFDGNGIKGYDQYGQTVSIGTNGTITALRGEIGGWIIGDDSLESTGMRDMDSYDPQTSTPVKTIIIKSNGMIYTSDFVSGYSGWRIDSEGNVEFNSAIIRGSIKSAVFEYDKVSAVGGKMLVKEASIIIDNPDHVTTSTKIHVLNPESFNTGDCFLVKYDASHLFYGVISAVDKTTSSNTYGDITYSIPSNAGTFFRTITVDGETVPVLDGLSIVNYGQPSAGGLMIDGNNTHIDIFRNISTNNQHTFSGDAIQLEHLARFGNMNGIGGITTDVYGLYIGDANGFIRYDPDGGLVIKNDITSGGLLKSDNLIPGEDAVVHIVADSNHVNTTTKLYVDDVSEFLRYSDEDFGFPTISFYNRSMLDYQNPYINLMLTNIKVVSVNESESSLTITGITDDPAYPFSVNNGDSVSYKKIASEITDSDYTVNGMFINLNEGIIVGSLYKFESDGDITSKGTITIEYTNKSYENPITNYTDVSLATYGNIVLYNNINHGVSAYSQHANGCIILNSLHTLVQDQYSDVVRLKPYQNDFNSGTAGPQFSIDLGRTYKKLSYDFITNSNRYINRYEHEPCDYNVYTEDYRNIVMIHNGEGIYQYHMTDFILRGMIQLNTEDELWKSGLHIVSDSTHVNTKNKIYLDDVTPLSRNDAISLKVNGSKVSAWIDSVDTTENSVSVSFSSYYQFDTFTVVDGDDITYHKSYFSSGSEVIFVTEELLDQISTNQQFIVCEFNPYNDPHFWGKVSSIHHYTEQEPYSFFRYTYIGASDKDYGERAADDRTYSPKRGDYLCFYSNDTRKGLQFYAEMTVAASIIPLKYEGGKVYENYRLGYSYRKWSEIYGNYGSFGYMSGTPNISKVEIGTDVYYGEGMRIYSGSSSNAGIMLAGRDNLSATGTSANSYYIVNENGTFKIYKNTTAVLTYDTTNGLTSDGGFTGNLTGTATNADKVKCSNLTSGTVVPLGISENISNNSYGDVKALVNDVKIQRWINTSNNQGFSIIKIGNNKSIGTDGNSTAAFHLYGSGANHMTIDMGTIENDNKGIIINSPLTEQRTYTLPNASGTIALTSSNITGSSASCTGNAASATYTTNIRVKQNSVSNWYNLVYTSGKNANTNYEPLVNTNSALRFYGTSNPSSTNSSTKTYAYLAIGNGIDCRSDVTGRAGILILYGQRLGCTSIVPGHHYDDDITLTLPASSGTLALASSCDQAIKTNLQDVDCLEILKTLPVKRFKYSRKKIQEKQWKTENPDTPLSEMPEFKDNEHEPWYIHTMAKDFNEAFDVDDGNPDIIQPINEIGVCLRAIQELAEKVDKLEQKIAQLS